MIDRFFKSKESKNNHCDKKTYYKDLINQSYRILLLRDADEYGLDIWTDPLSKGTATLEDLLNFIVKSQEFSNNLKNFFNHHIAGSPTLIDYSQNGEFTALLPHLVDIPQDARVVVDVGAHARLGSNTYGLMKAFGWRGVLIEPNPDLISGLLKDFDGLDFSLHQVAVSDEPRTAQLHFGIHPEIASLDRDKTAYWGDVVEAIDVKVVTLSSILEDCKVPKNFALLSVDAEGEDFKIIHDVISHGYLPSWIIIEAYLPEQIETLDPTHYPQALIDNYNIIGRTHANLILERHTRN